VSKTAKEEVVYNIVGSSFVDGRLYFIPKAYRGEAHFRVAGKKIPLSQTFDELLGVAISAASAQGIKVKASIKYPKPAARPGKRSE